MSRHKDNGKLIARIASPGSDSRNGVRQMREHYGDNETSVVYMPRRGQMLIGPRWLTERFTSKTRVRHILTGKDDPKDAV